MKRSGKKGATDRSFVVALSRGLDVLRAFQPNDGLLGNQEIAARTNLPKPTVSRLTYTLTKLGYLAPVPRFEKYTLTPSAMTLGVQLDVGSRVPIATTAMGRAFIWALSPDERAALLRELREHYGSRWPKLRDGIERSGEFIARHGFAISAGDWHDDIAAAGVALKLNDGTGPYAFNCGAPAFRFTEDRLRNDIGPRLLAMVKNIEATLGGMTPQTRKVDGRRMRAGGKVARVVEGIR